MLTVFTICSVNYLAQAKTLGSSLLQHNPGYQYLIFLVDRIDHSIDENVYGQFDIIPIEDVGIDGFEEMVIKYNITELNTAVKPFIFEYLFAKNNAMEGIIYLDPDIMVFQPFIKLEQSLGEYNIIITPHFFTPLNDNLRLDEADILNAGLYNLGFLAVKRSEESSNFLTWWKIKLKDLCYIAFEKGLFVDQIWINFVPLYYEKVLILRHMGYNFAYWNFHERVMSFKDGKYLVNGKDNLVFFHFSGYIFTEVDVVSKYQNRFTFDSRPDVLKVFREYTDLVLQNGHAIFSEVPCYFVTKRTAFLHEQQSLIQKDKYSLRRVKRVAKRQIQRFTKPFFNKVKSN